MTLYNTRFVQVNHDENCRNSLGQFDDKIMMEIETENDGRSEEQLKESEEDVEFAESDEDAGIVSLFMFNNFLFHSFIIRLSRFQERCNTLEANILQRNVITLIILLNLIKITTEIPLMTQKGFNPQHHYFHSHCYTISHDYPPPSHQHSLNVCMQLGSHTHYNCSQQKSINQIEVDQEQVLDGLLKYNTSLTKYLSKYYRKPQNSDMRNEGTTNYEYGGDENRIDGRKIDKYVSIIEEKKLNFGIPDNTQLPGKQQQEQIEQQRQAPQLIETAQQTSPRNQKPKPNASKSPKNLPHDQQKLNDYYKKLRQQSRYLSDTGFRKHFHRQCFENYGRKNTTGVADGIMYGNYLKTYNINPHTGANLPQKEETYEHALISASPEKYEEYQRIHSPKREVNDSLKHRCEQTINEASHECEQIQHLNLEREDYDLKGTIAQNLKSQKARDKYNHMKLRKKSVDEEWEEQHQRKIEIPQQSAQRIQNNFVRNQKHISPRSIEKGPQIIQNNIRSKFQQKHVSAPEPQPIYHNYHPQSTQQQQQQQLPPKPSANKKHLYPRIYDPPIIQRASYRDTIHTFAGNCFQSPTAINQLSVQLLQKSFTNPNLAHYIIDYASDFNCQICKYRQYTKCCCKNK